MKTLAQAKQLSETEQAVADYLTYIGVVYSVASTGTDINQDGWKCDGWRVSFQKGADREAFADFDYFTGTGHRVNTWNKATAPDGGPMYRKGTVAYERFEKQYIVPFPPAAASVLHGLLLDAQANDSSFNNWCEDYGYDSDSMKAFGIYQACCESAKKMHRVFNREQIDKLIELLQDY